MLKNVQYYLAVNGRWQGIFGIRVRSWKGLLTSSIGFREKCKLFTAVFLQKVIGRFQAKTRVDFKEEQLRVDHSAQMIKWGICIYKGHKVLLLDRNGKDLLLSGSEFYWPFIGKPSHFESSGYIEETGDKACYQMPLLGILIEIKSVIDSPDQVTLTMENEWIEGTFVLHKVA